MVTYNESIRELIALNREAEMLGITIANGFNHDIREEQVRASVTRVAELTDADKPVISIEIGDEVPIEVPNMGAPRKYRNAFQLFTDGYVESVDPAERRRDRERLARDVRKKMLEDYTCGGYASNLLFVRLITDEGELAFKNLGSFSIEWEVHYDFIETDP